MTITTEGETYEIQRDSTKYVLCEGGICPNNGDWFVSMVHSESASNGFQVCDQHLCEWMSSHLDDERLSDEDYIRVLEEWIHCKLIEEGCGMDEIGAEMARLRGEAEEDT